MGSNLKKKFQPFLTLKHLENLTKLVYNFKQSKNVWKPKINSKKKNFSRLDLFFHEILRLNNTQVKLHNQMEPVKSKIDLFVAVININKIFIRYVLIIADKFSPLPFQLQ